MAELEAAIFTRLSGYAGLTALTSTRIYPLILPQSPTYPAVTYQRISDDEEQALGSAMGLAHPRIQFNAWGKTFASAMNVMVQLKAALSRWNDAGASPVVLDSIPEKGAGGQDYEPDTGVFHLSKDFEIWHRE